MDGSIRSTCRPNLSSSKVDESPKWLLSTARYDEARALLEKIIEVNKLDKNINVEAIIENVKAAVLLVSFRHENFSNKSPRDFADYVLIGILSPTGKKSAERKPGRFTTRIGFSEARHLPLGSIVIFVLFPVCYS